MRKVIIALLACTATLSFAAPDDTNEIYVCVEEDATGFNWINGKWVKASFKPETWVVKRIPSYKHSSPEAMREYSTFLCAKEGEPPNFLDKTLRAQNACYSIVQLGKPMTPATYSPCTEYYEKGKLDVVHCEAPNNLSFSPKGQFIKKPWHSDVSAAGKNSKKDSLVLSVGKCSQTKLD